MPILGSVAFSGKAKATRPGQPSTPSIVSQASGQVQISWTAPSFSGGAPITDYKIEYSTNGGSSWTTWTHVASAATTQIVTGLPNYLTYIFRVSAINAVGTGTASENSPNAPQLNIITGGSETTVSNYNGTGQTWKVHTFASTTSFSVTSSFESFRVFLHGQGGSGGGDVWSGGGGGGMVWNDSATLSTGAYNVTIGSTSSVSGGFSASVGSGSSVGRNQGNGPAGAVNTVPSGWSSSSGGLGGIAATCDGCGAGNGNGGRTSDITGTSLGYCGGGGGGAWPSAAGTGVNGGGNGQSNPSRANPALGSGGAGARGGGGGGAAVYGNGGSGGAACLYIAYRIA